MLTHIRQESRSCAKEMVKAMRKVCDRNFYINHKNITGYVPDILFQKPELSLNGRKYYSRDTHHFGTFVFKDNKLWVRVTSHDLEKYPEGSYIDFNFNQPAMFLSSQYRRKQYQPIPISEKQYNILRNKVQELIQYQELYGCQGFMFRVNYMTMTMFVVFDPQGNPYHLSDGLNSVERFFL